MLYLFEKLLIISKADYLNKELILAFVNKSLCGQRRFESRDGKVSGLETQWVSSPENQRFSSLAKGESQVSITPRVGVTYKELKMEFLNEVINGYLMSDGYVSLLGSLTIHHTSKQEKFVEWLYDILCELRTESPIKKIVRFDPRTNKAFCSCRFATKNTLKEYRALWYKPCVGESGKISYRKTLPDSIESFFGPVFITLWFAGDGTKILSHKGAKFEVTAFTVSERLRLQALFKSKYDIETSINRAGKTKKGTLQWTLNIKAKDYSKFYSLVTQFDLIPKLFPHKLWK
jgi:hypothetical protein